MKKTMKRILAMTLAVVMTIGALPLSDILGLELPDMSEFGGFKKLASTVSDFFGGFAPKVEAATSGTCGKNLTWIFDESTGTLTVSGTGEMYGFGNPDDAPWEYYKYDIKYIKISDGITSIGNEAFSYCPNLLNVYIPDSMKSIGAIAFVGCESVTEIKIPAGVTSIGESAFAYCNNLNKITVDKGNSSYFTDEYGALLNKDMTALVAYPCGSTNTSYAIPEGVKYIGSALCYSSNLISISIPASLTELGYYSFSGCTSLSKFSVAFENENFSTDEYGVLYNKDKTVLIAYPSGSPNADYSIPEGVIKIDNSAFSSCKNLENISISGSLKNLGNNNFYSCSNLLRIDVDSENTEFSSDDEGVLYNKNKTVLISYPSAKPEKNYAVSEGITGISRYTFYGCQNLETLSIPLSIRNIERYSISGSSVSKIYYNGTYEQWKNISLEYNSNLEYKLFFEADSGNPYRAGECGENLIWKFYEDGKLVISGTGEMTDYGRNAPWYRFRSSIVSVEVEDGVTGISDYVFYECSNLKTVTVSDSVTSIGEYAFERCQNLLEIKLSDNLTSIGDYAFSQCKSLETVIIPDTVIYLGKYAFNYCNSLSTVKLSENLTEISEYAFYNCSYLAGIVLPDKVTEIGKYAFYKCVSLSNLKFPVDLECINEYAFSYCSSLKSVTIPDGVTEIKNSAFSECSGIKNIKFGKNVISIGDSAFARCSNLEVLELPDTLKNIGGSAFCYCSRLTELTIPDGVINVGSSAFYSCQNITDLTLPDSIVTFGENAFYLCSKLKNVFYRGDAKAWCSVVFENEYSNPINYAGNLYFDETLVSGTVDLPDGTYEIGNYAFYGYEKIVKVNISDGVKKIGDYAFRSCTGLASMIISDSVIYIGDYAFRDCKYLNNVTFGKNLKNIGDYAFYGCTGLKTVTIPDGVESIGERVFYGCSSLDSVVIPGSLTSLGAYAFYNCKNLKDLYYTGKFDQWCSMTFSSYTENPISDVQNFYIDNVLIQGDFTIPDGIKEIKNYVFYSFDGFTGLTIPDSVVSIGERAFSGCKNLTDLTIGSGIEIMGVSAFAACHDLKTVVFKNGAKITGDNTFYNCERLTDVIIPGSVETIGNYVFYNCTALTNVTISDGVKTIGDYAFAFCGALSDITLPDGLTKINGYAFFACLELNDIKIPDSVTAIGEKAFYGCFKFKNIFIPKNVAEIGQGAFCACQELERVTVDPENENFVSDDFGALFDKEKTILICYPVASTNVSYTVPDGVKTIGFGAFGLCASIEEIIMPDGLKEIKSVAFSACTNLKNINIPDGTEVIETSAFSGCSSLENLTLPDSLELVGADAFKDTAFLENNSNRDNGVYYLDTILIKADPTQVSGSYEIRPQTTLIAQKAFLDCVNLNSVTLPEGLRVIGDEAFSGCSNLRTAVVPDSVIYIGKDAFKLCKNMSGFKLPDNLQTIGANAFLGCNMIVDVTIPNGVTSIGSSAFSSCTGIKNVVFSGCVTNISTAMFYGCVSLETVDMGNNVTGIGELAFYGCKKLKEVKISKKVEKIDEYAFYECAELEEVEIPLSAKELGKAAFAYCSDLKNINLGSINAIKENTFYGCWQLSEIFIPKTVKSIEKAAFYMCEYLDKVEGCEGLETIGEYAFAYTAINAFPFSKSLKSIGEHAFWYCVSIKELYIPENVEHIGYLAFGNLSSLKKTEVSEANEHYSSDEYGVLFNKDKTELIQYPVANEREYYFIPRSVLVVDDYGFSAPGTFEDKAGFLPDYNGHLITVYVSENVETFGKKAFHYHGTLKNVRFSQNSNLNSVGAECYSECITLENIIFPDSLETIGEHAFYNCQSLKDGWLHVPATVKVFGDKILLKAVKHIYDDNGILVDFKQVGICSTTAICIPETYAKENNYPFMLCEGHEYSDPDHEHSYTSSVTTPATCEKDGVMTYTCECGESYADVIPATGHDIEVTVSKVADCTENGLEIHSCKNCGSTANIVINAKGHCYVLTSETSPSCIEAGIKTYTCSECGDVKTEETPVTDHTPGEWETATEATCTQNGEKIKKCTGCYMKLASQEIPAYGHRDGTSYISKAPTCTEEGQLSYKCGNCGQDFRTENIPANGHIPGEWVVTTEPTETVVGVKTQYCTVCNSVLGTREIGTLEHIHKPQTITIPATCTVAGMEYDICESCGETIGESRVLPAKGHTAGEWEITVEATCTENGEKVKKCVDCGIVVETAVIVSGGHITKTVKINPTCTVAGMEYDICEFCGETIGDARVIPAIGHKPGSWVVSIEPDCVNAGEKVRYCTVCSVICDTEIIPAKGHVPGEWIVISEPTTESTGKKIRKCVVCGVTVEEQIIPKKTVLTDSETGVGVEINSDDYDGDVDIVVEESFDGAAFNLVNTETGAAQTMIYDIRITVDGNEVQPNGSVRVRMPLPDGFDASRTFIYHVDTATGKVENMKAVVETINGKKYLVFETTHFSYYAIVEEVDFSIKIQSPSKTTINYGDSIVLHAVSNSSVPDGYYYSWVSSNGNFVLEPNGDTCKVSPVTSGNAVITLMLCDDSGSLIAKDELTMTSKAGFFQKIIAFFKSIFGLNKTYPNVFKGIF